MRGCKNIQVFNLKLVSDKNVTTTNIKQIRIRKDFNLEIMEPKRWHLQLSCFFLLLSSTFSDVGKITSSQNHFGNTIQSQFTTKNNTRVIAQKGGLAILPCVVKINSPATVSWIRRKDFQLLTVGLSTHSSDKRFLVEHTRHMGHWSLRIKAVKEEDRGFYECQLSIYPTQSIFIELKIVEAVAEISSAPELHIDETSTLRLECKLKRATENPSFVFWYHDNKMINYDVQGGFVVTSMEANGKSSVQNGHIFRVLPGVAGNKSRIIPIPDPMESMNGVMNSKNAVSSANFISPNPPYLQTHQSSYLLTPSMSVLSIKQVNFRHAGNYTCAPSNARPASISVHVLRGEKTAAMQHANRSSLDSENISNSTFGLTSIGGINGTVNPILAKSLLYISSIFVLVSVLSNFRLLKAVKSLTFLAFIILIMES
ncbi:uncharacterized protein LOC117899979 [Drosophila subobscura]|uniref:uncharacterized protein LOC117899979 n=1 Tax=Drosophila subobscura TaxID=7241 RepID=UPI00155AA977|nr:uncharacterized protein LOC117899979 [Drosophila subobscura]